MLAIIVYKSSRRIFRLLLTVYENIVTSIILKGNGAKFGTFQTKGIPFVSVAQGATCMAGDGLILNNELKGNPIGRPQPCIFFADKEAVIRIGRNVGMSSAALIARCEIVIGDNVKLGGGVCIYDTDFHSLSAIDRLDSQKDRVAAKKYPVIIGDNVFIGAHSTILKGVTIGENAVIGACSVVTKNIPANEIWAGNPAKLVRRAFIL